MTEKQRKFADEYWVDLDRTRAYKAAYPNVKKDNVACAAATRLLGNVKVKAYIDQKLEEISSAKIAEAKEVMEYLTAVMRREHKDVVVVTCTSEESMYVPDDKNRMRKQTVKRDEPRLVEIPAKLSDANKAAELLGKRYAMWTDKAEVSVALPYFDGEDQLED